MAKKKVTKKTKKKTKKGKSKPPKEFTEQEKIIILHQKIHAVMRENPSIECTLVGEDEDRKFGICEAAEVFRMYSRAMVKHNLTFLPVQKKTTLGNGCVLVETTFQITDITTGYHIFVPGSGLGMNFQWSANSASTLAKKQAMLETFNCSWPQQKEYRAEVQRTATRAFGPAQSPQQISEAIKDHFGKYPMKGKPK